MCQLGMILAHLDSKEISVKPGARLCGALQLMKSYDLPSYDVNFPAA